MSLSLKSTKAPLETGESTWVFDFAVVEETLGLEIAIKEDVRDGSVFVIWDCGVPVCVSLE